MNKLSKALTLVFIFSLLVKILDILRSLIISSVLGVSNHADIYLGLITVPDSILVITGFDSIRGVVNSEYSGLFSKGHSKEIWDSFSNLFKIIFVFSLFVTIFLFLNRSLFINILFPGFSEDKKILAIAISTAVIPIFFLKSLIGLFQSVLNSQKKFYSPVLLPSIISILVVISILIPYFNNEILFNLSFGNLAGNILVCVGFCVIIYKIGGKIKLGKIKIDAITKKVLKSCAAIFTLVFFNQLYLSSKNFFASYCGDGAISSLNYAGTITTVIATLIFTSVFGVLVSDLSSGFVVEKKSVTKSSFINSFNVLFYLIIPIVVFLLVNRNEILELLYLRGNFDKIGISKTVTPFIWESMFLVSFILYIIPTALYLAKKEYKLLTKIGIPVYIAGIFLNYLFSKLFGYTGISISSFVIHFSYGIILIIYSQKMIGKITVFLKQCLFMLFSGLLSFIILIILKIFIFDVYPFLFNKNIIILLIYNITLCSFSYYYISSFFKVNFISKVIKNYLVNKRNL